MNVLYCKRHKQIAQVRWACPESDGFCNVTPMRLIPDNAETVIVETVLNWDSNYTTVHLLAEQLIAALDGETP